MTTQTPESTSPDSPAQVAAAIAEIIRDKPWRWNQGSWFDRGDIPITHEQPYPVVDLLRESLDRNTCGSTACVAGWAAILTAPLGSLIVGDGYFPRVRFPDGQPDKYVAEVGGVALGLEVDDAEWLFESCRSKEEVLRALDWIAGGNSNLDGAL